MQYLNNYWMRFLICDIQNNQGWGRGYKLKPKAEADNLTKAFVGRYRWFKQYQKLIEPCSHYSCKVDYEDLVTTSTARHG